MPKFNPSTAQRNIVVLQQVGTSLTISAPGQVNVGQSFSISGILVRNDTGGPVVGVSITLSRNGVSLGSATTDVDGSYLRSGVSIPSEGTFTLTASFGGATLGGLKLNASQSSTRTGTGAELPSAVIAMLALIAGAYLLSKKR